MVPGYDGKSGAQLPQRDEREPYFIGPIDCLNHLRVTAARIRVAIGVRAPISLPQFPIDSVLSCQGAVEGAITPPGACNIAEITLRARLATEAGATRQGFDGYLIQALALLPRVPTEGSI